MQIIYTESDLEKYASYIVNLFGAIKGFKKAIGDENEKSTDNDTLADKSIDSSVDSKEVKTETKDKDQA